MSEEKIKTIKVYVTESYETWLRREVVVLNIEDYPELDGKTKEEILEYIEENNEDMKSTDESSYDSLSGGRKNILSSIPISERIISNTGIIQYEPAEKNFIALNNRNQLSLRNIRARITTDSFDPISTEGLSTVTVIIKSPVE